MDLEKLEQVYTDHVYTVTSIICEKYICVGRPTFASHIKKTFEFTFGKLLLYRLVNSGVDRCTGSCIMPLKLFIGYLLPVLGNK